MNIRVKAALITVGLLAASAAGASILAFLVVNLTAEQISNVIFAGFVGFCIYVLYSITLSRLEFDEKIKQMREEK